MNVWVYLIFQINTVDVKWYLSSLLCTNLFAKSCFIEKLVSYV